MKTNLPPLFAVLATLAALFPVSASWAALPEMAQVVQAEAMTLAGEGWTVREHSPDNWYASRPVGQMLGGQNKHAGTATATFKIPAAGCINKYDLNPGISDSIREYCGKEGIPVLGMIPYDESVMDAVRKGRLVTEYDTPAAQAIHHLWHEIVSTLRVRADAGQ